MGTGAIGAGADLVDGPPSADDGADPAGGVEGVTASSTRLIVTVVGAANVAPPVGLLNVSVNVFAACAGVPARFGMGVR